MTTPLDATGLTLNPGVYTYGPYPLGGASNARVSLNTTLFSFSGPSYDVELDFDDGAKFSAVGMAGDRTQHENGSPTFAIGFAWSQAQTVTLKINVAHAIHADLRLDLQ